MADNRLTRGTALLGGVQIDATSEVKGLSYGTASIDFDSVAAGETGSATVTVTGAASGDIVVVNPPALTTGLGFAGAAVTAANTVTVYVVNASAAPIDEGAATFSYLWVDLT